VPEASMDEDNGAIAWKNQVRFAGQLAAVETEAKSFRM